MGLIKAYKQGKTAESPTVKLSKCQTDKFSRNKYYLNVYSEFLLQSPLPQFQSSDNLFIGFACRGYQ